MFGGIGLFLEGMMFGLIAREKVFFEVGDANRPKYQAAGEAPLSYLTRHGSHTIGSYWRCPRDLLDNAESLQAWATLAVAAARAASRRKPKPTRKRGARG